MDVSIIGAFIIRGLSGENTIFSRLISFTAALFQTRGNNSPGVTHSSMLRLNNYNEIKEITPL